MSENWTQWRYSCLFPLGRSLCKMRRRISSCRFCGSKKDVDNIMQRALLFSQNIKSQTLCCGFLAPFPSKSQHKACMTLTAYKSLLLFARLPTFSLQLPHLLYFRNSCKTTEWVCCCCSRKQHEVEGMREDLAFLKNYCLDISCVRTTCSTSTVTLWFPVPKKKTQTIFIWDVRVVQRTSLPNV
jgi:hypothetical protein